MLTSKQENFVINLLKGMNQSAAYQLAYGCKSANVAKVNASRLLTKANVKAKYEELTKQTESAAVMSVEERKARLSEIARARLTDYQESGADGAGYINIGKESPNTAAIAGIKSSTKFDENGNTGTLYTEVKLHNPIAAIAELNKMDNLYDDSAKLNVKIDNRKVEIIVCSDNARELTERIMNGETPNKLDCLPLNVI